ncbi:MAG: hypothetical protein ABEJ76_09685 [Halanaeroarchaeum sp.]
MTRSTGLPATESGEDLDHRIETYQDGATCTIFPRDAGEDELVTTWITAEEGSFVGLDDWR